MNCRKEKKETYLTNKRIICPFIFDLKAEKILCLRTIL
jgi:hypothetical protein